MYVMEEEYRQCVQPKSEKTEKCENERSQEAKISHVGENVFMDTVFNIHLFSHSYNRDFVCGLRQEEESSKGIIGIP
jgi:hypothetical protein